MPLDLPGLSEVLQKMPLRKEFLVQFYQKKLEVKTKSEAKMSALVLLGLIASQVGNWLPNCYRNVAPGC
jgi:hypothetical protein